MADKDTEIPVKVVDRRRWAQAPAGEATTASAWQPEKPSYVQELEGQLAEKERVLQETIANFRQTSREFDESRVRLRKDVAGDVERGRRTMLVELLDVVDNLDRAIEAGRAAGDSGPLQQGVELVRQQFLDKLAGFGVTRIDPLGEPFDPLRHEAVTAVPVREPPQDGIVLGILQPGYLSGDEVIRPARVAVGQLASE